MIFLDTNRVKGYSQEMSIAAGTLYMILKRLKEAGYVETYLQASASCSRAVLNGVNGTVLFEGTCKESLQAKSVNGSVKLYLPHDLSDATVSASTVTGKIRLTEKGNTSSFSKHFTQKSDVSSLTIQASTVNGNVTLSDQPVKD